MTNERMTNEQIEAVIEALKSREAVVKALMEQRAEIDRKLRILGVEGAPPPEEKKKRGRPFGTKNKPKPLTITESATQSSTPRWNERNTMSAVEDQVFRESVDHEGI